METRPIAWPFFQKEYLRVRLYISSSKIQKEINFMPKTAEKKPKCICPFAGGGEKERWLKGIILPCYEPDWNYLQLSTSNSEFRVHKSAERFETNSVFLRSEWIVRVSTERMSNLYIKIIRYKNRIRFLCCLLIRKESMRVSGGKLIRSFDPNLWSIARYSVLNKNCKITRYLVPIYASISSSIIQKADL